MAKEFLSQHQIGYVEKNIDVDLQARQELAQRNIRGVPTFMIGDDFIVGLDKEKILQLVDHRVILCENCQARMRIPIGKGQLKVTCPKCRHQFNVQS